MWEILGSGVGGCPSFGSVRLICLSELGLATLSPRAFTCLQVGSLCYEHPSYKYTFKTLYRGKLEGPRELLRPPQAAEEFLDDL